MEHNFQYDCYILFPSPNEDSQKHEFGFPKWNEIVCVLKCEKG